MVQHEKRTDWAKIAAWCFGSWALMLPIAAGIVIQNQTKWIEGQDRLYKEIARHREEVLQAQKEIYAEQARFNANQIEVMRRLTLLESRHLTRSEEQ